MTIQELESHAGVYSSTSYAEVLLRSLVINCGSYIAAWRRHFDRDGFGFVGRRKFQAGCKRLRLEIDAEAAFSALTRRCAEERLHFYDLDPEAGQVLTKLAFFIRERFRSTREAFSSGISHDPREASLSLQGFMRACMEMGFECDEFRLLFSCIDFAGRGLVMFEDLDFLDRWEGGDGPPPPDINEELIRILGQAAPMDEVCALVERHADPNALPRRNPASGKAGEGCTALLQAAERGTVQHIELLLRWGADPQGSRNSYGHTALHRAAARAPGRVDATRVVQLLLGADAEVNVATQNGQTPLHIAASGSRVEIVALLCHCKANVKLCDASGHSALFFATSRQSFQCCEALLEAMADPCWDDRKDDSPIAYAVDKRLEAVLGLLQRHTQKHYVTQLRETLDFLYNSESCDWADEEAQESVATYVALAAVPAAAIVRTINLWRRGLPGRGACSWPEATEETLLDWPRWAGAPRRPRGALHIAERRQAVLANNRALD